MAKIKLFSLIFLFSLGIKNLEAQKQFTWLIKPQSEWKPDSAGPHWTLNFVNSKGEKRVFSPSKKDFIGQDDTEKIEYTSAADLYSIYDKVKKIGNVAYEVEKYGMTAIVDKNNKQILPYTKNPAKIEILSDSSISALTYYDYLYHFDNDGKVTNVSKSKNNIEINPLRLEDANYILYNYFTQKTVNQDTFAYINDIPTMKNLFIAEQKDKSVGLIDHTGKIIIPFEYKELYAGKNNCFLAKKNDDTYGLITMQNKVIIPFDKTNLRLSYRRLIIYKDPKTQKEGAYNYSGKKIIEPLFTDFESRNGKFITAEIGYNKKIVFDTLGNLMWKDTVFNVYEIPQSYFYKVETKTGKGIRRIDGTWLVPPLAKTDLLTNDNYIGINASDIEKFKIAKITPCKACKEDVYLFNIDHFEPLVANPCKIIYPEIKFGKDTLLVSFKDKKGIIEVKKGIVLPLEYDDITILLDGTIVLKKNNKITLFDRKWKKIYSDDTFENVMPLEEDATHGHYVQTKTGKGIQRKDGSWIVKPVTNSVHIANSQFIWLNRADAAALGISISDNTSSMADYLFDKNLRFIYEKPVELMTGWGLNWIQVLGGNLEDSFGLLNDDGVILLEPIYGSIFYNQPNKTLVLVQKGDSFGIGKLTW